MINKKEGISEESPYTSSELVKIIHSVNKANKLCWKGSNNNEIDTIVITHDYGTKNGLGYYLARNAGDYDLGALLRTDTSPESAYDNDYRIAFGKVIRDVGLLCEAGYFPVDFKPANLQVKQVKIPKSNIDKQYNKIKIFLIDTNSICSVENPSYTQTTVYCNNRVHFKWHTDSTRNKYNGQVKVDFAIAMSLLELEGVDLDPLTNQLLGNKGVKQNDPILQKFIETHIQPKYKKDFENLVCFPSIYLVNLEKDKPAKVTGVYKMFKPTSPYYYHDHANNNNDQANNNSNEPSQSLHIKA
ncbi:MAG: hypothetical protein QG673_1108 [Pseudomonadota bacterium]|nr:hypothetical protein [Pseudomonadota bacterium]